MTLHYLDFDYSEDEHGYGCFDAMASVPAQRVAAVHADIAQVLDWAHQNFADQRAPLEEGGEWDYLLDSQQEWAVSEVLDYDEVTGRFHVQRGEPSEPRHTVTLAISGTARFCEAFRARFGV